MTTDSLILDILSQLGLHLMLGAVNSVIDYIIKDDLESSTN